jgi:hypothetical protein
LRDTRWLFELVDLHLLSFLRRHEQIDSPFKIGSFAPQICPRVHEGWTPTHAKLALAPAAFINQISVRSPRSIHPRFGLNILNLIGQRIFVDGAVIDFDAAFPINPQQSVLHPRLIIAVGIIFVHMRAA